MADLRIKLYLNTERNHRGVVTSLFLGRMTGSTSRERLDSFKQFCFDELRAHTPVMRIYKIPSHQLVKSVQDIQDGGEYLILGKEFTLGRPSHKSRDYPLILTKRRIAYLRQKRARRAGGAGRGRRGEEPEPELGPEPAPRDALDPDPVADDQYEYDDAPADDSMGEDYDRDVVARGGGGDEDDAVLIGSDRATPGYSRVGRLKALPKFGYVGATRGSLNHVKVRLYLYTERNHRGLTGQVPLARFRSSGTSEKERLELFKQWCFATLKAHTPVQRIYEVPSHKLIRRIGDLKPMVSYLVVGKEYLLGNPEHNKRDYPLALVEDRRDYLRRNPKPRRRRGRGRARATGSRRGE